VSELHTTQHTSAMVAELQEASAFLAKVKSSSIKTWDPGGHQ